MGGVRGKDTGIIYLKNSVDQKICEKSLAICNEKSSFKING
jgi:hypothetical protein